MDRYASLIEKVVELGAFRASMVSVDQVVFDQGFRSLCESNACGNFGRNWMCPPFVGEIQDLMDQAKAYQSLLVYQTVGELEDSYDFEGMMEVAERHNQLTSQIRRYMDAEGWCNTLHLGAGGCSICPTCAKRQEEPCRHPDLALASFETYGVDVSQLAKAANMKYINGQDTVTYFSGVFFKEEC